MALARNRRDRGVDYWPGFVDALSTLLLGIIFLLSIFAVVQFYLSQEMTGKDTALQRLNAQIAQLTDLLVARKDRPLRSRRAARAPSVPISPQPKASATDCAGSREGAGSAAAAQGKANELASQLDLEKQSVARALAQVEILNQQIAALRRQLGAIEAALEVPKSATAIRRPGSPISGKGSISRWPSACRNCSATAPTFSAGCAPILGNRPDVRIVGDRFVFQSEVFFDAGQAVLKPEGRAEIDKIADALTRTRKTDPARHRLGHARRWPYRHPADRQCAIPLELGTVGGARDRGRAVHDLARGSRRSAWSPPASANSSRSTPKKPKTPSAATAGLS